MSNTTKSTVLDTVRKLFIFASVTIIMLGIMYAASLA